MNEHQYSDSHWMGSWIASQTYFDGKFAEDQFKDQTIRMIIRPHAFGSKIRLKFSNLYGSEPAVFGKVTAALAAKDGETVPGTGRQVTLNGQFTIVGRIFSLNDFAENLPPFRSPFSMQESLAIKY